MPIATPTQNSNGSPSVESSSAPPAASITFATFVHPRPSSPKTSGWPSRLRIPAAGSTAIGNWSERPIFCKPWKNFPHGPGPAVAALVAALIRIPPVPTGPRPC
ncbi:hypothetical protein GA0115246_1138715 [Streptomyces sp. SolWspMP-sol7th]|nr:hypothetical protein GA0115246_1138715 [Streptomyces sp. SolWspMP-sol7th]